MTPQDCVIATKDAVVDVGGRFMADMQTYAKGAELGFPGISFYYARWGVLGGVDAEVVEATAFWFAPETVRLAWGQLTDTMDPREAATRLIACGHDWARTNLTDVDSLDRLADLAGRINSAAGAAGLPLFAAWQATDRPADAPARALHEIHVLRELRGAAHGIAVRCIGLEPLTAVMINSPNMAAVFGWPEPWPEPDEADVKLWNEAEAISDGIVSEAYAVLDFGELEDFVELCEAIR